MAEPDYSANPLTKLRQLVVARPFTAFTPITDAIGGADGRNVQFWVTPNDIRGDLAGSERAPHRVMIRPVMSRTDFAYSSGSVAFVERFEVNLYVDSDSDARPIDYLRWQLMRALAFLNMKTDFDGDPLDLSDLAPLVIDDIRLEEIPLDREPAGADVDQWVGVCDVIVTGTVGYADLMAP